MLFKFYFQYLEVIPLPETAIFPPPMLPTRAAMLRARPKDILADSTLTAYQLTKAGQGDSFHLHRSLFAIKSLNKYEYISNYKVTIGATT